MKKKWESFSADYISKYNSMVEKVDILQHKYFSLAYNTAKQAEYRIRVGAVVVKNKRIYSAACNVNKTHPFLKKFKYEEGRKLHAEMNACLRLDSLCLIDAVIFIVRINGFNQVVDSIPCKMCFTFLQNMGIKTIMSALDDKTTLKISTKIS